MKYQIQISRLEGKSIRLRPHLDIGNAGYWQKRAKKLLPDCQVVAVVAKLQYRHVGSAIAVK